MGGVVDGVVDAQGGVMGGGVIGMQEGQEGGILVDEGGVLGGVMGGGVMGGQMGQEGGILGPNMSSPASVAPPRKKVKANDVMMLSDGASLRPF